MGKQRVSERASAGEQRWVEMGCRRAEGVRAGGVNCEAVGGREASGQRLGMGMGEAAMDVMRVRYDPTQKPSDVHPPPTRTPWAAEDRAPRPRLSIFATSKKWLLALRRSSE